MAENDDDGGLANAIRPKLQGGDNSDKGQDQVDAVVDLLNGFATGTQDTATYIDMIFVVAEGMEIANGCLVGPEGCMAGALLGKIAFNVTGANTAEAFLSTSSFGLTALADLIDDGQFSKATGTSLVTAIAGAAMVNPIGDFAIDRYSSGYNHGIVNGIDALMNGAPILK
jgi:hypothetical protein